MRILDVIQGVEIIQHEDGHVSFLADASVDCDGSGGNPDNDPYFQPDTTLHNEGKALNAYQESFIVVPPVVVRRVVPVVMGCKARVLYRKTGIYQDAVVGDLGPTQKIGEVSVFLARLLGMSGNPNTGGESDMRMVLYEVWPGTPAIVNGVTYQLQPSHA